MKSIIETELPSSTGLYTGGAESESLLESGDDIGYTVSQVYRLSGVKKQKICSTKEFKIFFDSADIEIYVTQAPIENPIILVIDNSYIYSYESDKSSLATETNDYGWTYLTAIEFKSMIKQSVLDI